MLVEPSPQSWIRAWWTLETIAIFTWHFLCISKNLSLLFWSLYGLILWQKVKHKSLHKILMCLFRLRIHISKCKCDMTPFAHLNPVQIKQALGGIQYTWQVGGSFERRDKTVLSLKALTVQMHSPPPVPITATNESPEDLWDVPGVPNNHGLRLTILIPSNPTPALYPRTPPSNREFLDPHPVRTLHTRELQQFFRTSFMQRCELRLHFHGHTTPLFSVWIPDKALFYCHCIHGLRGAPAKPLHYQSKRNPGSASGHGTRVWICLT